MDGLIVHVQLVPRQWVSKSFLKNRSEISVRNSHYIGKHMTKNQNYLKHNSFLNYRFGHSWCSVQMSVSGTSKYQEAYFE